MKSILKGLALILFFHVASLAAAQVADVSGTWEATWSEKEKTCTAALVLRASGDQASGTVTDCNGAVWQVQSATLQEDELNFEVSVTENGGTTVLHLTGSFSNGEIKLREESDGQDDAPIMVFRRTDAVKDEERPCSRAQGHTAGPYVPLTGGEKFGCTMGVLVRPSFFVGIGLGAGIAQLEHAPSQWGQGAEGYGRRFGTFYGVAAFRQSVLFAGTSLLHEDPRPLRSQRHGFAPRTVDALKLAMQSRRDDGSRGFAWARTVADMGTGTLGMSVYPGHPITGRSTLNLSLAYFAGREASSEFSEFAPDIVRGLHLDGVARKLHLKQP